MSSSPVEELLRDARMVPFRGWDFSALGDRIRLQAPPWEFERLVDVAAAQAASMLDMGTGGGEFLSARRHAPRAVATESWPPNVPIAAARLSGFGITVIQDEGAVDNVEQSGERGRGRLPFRGEAFDLVTNRHEAFVAEELRRVLCPGGAFLTQQAGSGTRQFHRLLGLEPPPDREFHLDIAIAQLENAGFQIYESAVGVATTVFADIGALAWYLTNVPWAVPGFSIDDHHAALIALHGDPIRVASERFWLRAVA